MKRTIKLIIACSFVAGLIAIVGGCAARGSYFQTSRENKPRAFKNRIYNPADARYAGDEATG